MNSSLIEALFLAVALDIVYLMRTLLPLFQIARHMSPLETMISLLSAITHDLDHPGVNQAFLIATSNHLASLYKVRIPNPQTHVRNS